jgi:hypothetical protein
MPNSRGGFGEVRLATYQGHNDMPYAIKIMNKRRIIAMKQVQYAVPRGRGLAHSLMHPRHCVALTYSRSQSGFRLAEPGMLIAVMPDHAALGTGCYC